MNSEKTQTFCDPLESLSKEAFDNEMMEARRKIALLELSQAGLNPRHEVNDDWCRALLSVYAAGGIDNATLRTSIQLIVEAREQHKAKEIVYVQF